MTYGQVILILFVVLIGYYGFLIFMDIQHLKAAEAAAQENQSEEEIDITDEARSFQPQQVIRDDKKKEEEKKQEEAGNENDSNTDNSRQHLMSNRMRMLLLKVVKMFPIRKHQQLPNNQIFLFRQRILSLKQYHRLKLLSLIIKKKYLLPKLLIKMKLKILPMRMPKQPHRKLELQPDPTSHRPTGNPS